MSGDWLDELDVEDLVDDELLELGGAVCRNCGCSQNDPCVTPHGHCFWIEPDLCSGCAQ